MIFQGDLAPVGNSISLATSVDCRLENQLGPHQYWLDSGTSALALALLDAKSHFSDVDKPRAIIPGYCCPDLIAACVYAGVEAVAIDISPNDPAYDLEALRLHLDANVIAIIAVNFLGIGERLQELRTLISDLNLRTRLIEDNAQWFPSSVSEMEFSSDYVSFSFGRGKPMSLLGGGLLCAKAPIAIGASEYVQNRVPSPRLLGLKITAYNLLLAPQLYRLLNRNPWLSLGVTRYVPLEKIEHFDVYRRALLDENFTLHCARDNTVAQRYDSVVLNNGVQQLAANCTVRQRQLLRYPLLCRDDISRNKLLQQLSKAGLGASPMYASAIDRIEGVDGKLVVPGALTNAKDFAARFMTLPVHHGVTEKYISRILSLLSSA